MTIVDFYDKEQIDAKEIGAPDDAASSSGSLWARIKNAIMKDGGTVTGAVEVPTTPPTATSVVNSVYVNDATAGVNNIAHKTGNETLNGEKKLMDPSLMLDKAIGFKAGSATDYLEIVRASEDREMHIEIFTSSYKADIIVSLLGANWNLANGFGQIVKNTATLTFDSVITDNGDGTTSLWVKSTAAFCAYVRHNKNWRNNFGIENGYTTPNTISTTDPRTVATRYKNVTINQVVIQ